MPPIYQFDDYDKCLSINPSAYCVVYAEIEPNHSSQLWNQIDIYSKDINRHFRHDRLHFGVCVERCKSLLESLTVFERQQLYDRRIGKNEITEFQAALFKDETPRYSAFQEMLGKCLNYDFTIKYNLTLKTNIDYCDSNELPQKTDTFDIVVYSILASFAFVNVLSSLYDYYLRCQQPHYKQTYGFYETEHSNSVHRLLTSFSIYRNYYRLMAPITISSNKRLRFLNGYRALFVILNLFGHCVMFYTGVHIENTQFFEDYFHNPVVAIFQNGPVITQVFFLLCGFVLKMKFNEFRPITPEVTYKRCFGIFVKILTLRYLRLIPSLVIVMLFNASVLQYLGDGPFWRHMIEPERVFCRERWWHNVLMINNYFTHKPCSLHTWFLAADMQLTVLFLLVLILISKFPKLKILSLIMLTIISVAITAAVTYILKLETFIYFKPESFRFLFFLNIEEFYQSYVPFYTNMGGYIIGFILADIYANCKDSDSLNKWIQLGFWLAFPAGFGFLFSRLFFIDSDIERPSLWLALYAGLYRKVFIAIAMWAIWAMFYKAGFILYHFANTPFVRTLGRMSFQIYLWHFSVIRVVIGSHRQPVFLSESFMFFQIIVVFVITSLTAFAMTIILEFPMANVIKCISGNGNLQPTKGKETENNYQP
ncbi:nose resistant to fluoxetine protein 6-like [Glossina fuscipes]|uniref:Nose resistant to fluoxetine protein 6-like n=1 Tax=Glossina fuscipes TaxID=7396 RepID=A0A9C5YW58_9MUSC|nr:nose resistant to fluoxetine protein 6-like [Glossina fuscipes]